MPLSLISLVMQIMILWDSMHSLQNIQLFHLLLIPALTLPTLAQFIPHRQLLMLASLMPLMWIITGMAHQYRVKDQVLMSFLPLIFSTIAWSTTHLPSLWAVLVLEVLTLHQLLLLLEDLWEPMLIVQVQDLSCIHLLQATGMYWQSDRSLQFQRHFYVLVTLMRESYIRLSITIENFLKPHASIFEALHCAGLNLSHALRHASNKPVQLLVLGTGGLSSLKVNTLVTCQSCIIQ